MENTYKEIIKKCFSNSPQSQYLNFLKNLQKNYFNLKNEFLIRNFLLEFLNDRLPKGQKAFAEYPKYGNNRRTDLSIFDKRRLKDPVCIELKYQFPHDFFNEAVKDKIRQDMDGIKGKEGKEGKKGADIFILIVAEWDAAEDPLKEWGFEKTLSIYQNVPKDSDWGKEVRVLLAKKYTSIEYRAVIADKVKYHHWLLGV